MTLPDGDLLRWRDGAAGLALLALACMPTGRWLGLDAGDRVEFIDLGNGQFGITMTGAGTSR